MQLIGYDPLSRFLNIAAARPFAWGVHDCLLWLADWIETRCGVDPGAGFRGGRYSSMFGAARIVRDAGGMVRLVDQQVKAAGLSRVNVGARGDIAVVSVGGAGGEHFGNEAGAILLGGTAVLMCQEGLCMPRLADVPVLAAWKV
jgi:hypothetical protein